MIENCVQMSVFNLLTNSMLVNGQVYDIANQHAGFRKHFICEETLSHGDSPTCDQDISSIKYTCDANLTRLCRRHRETSTTINFACRNPSRDHRGFQYLSYIIKISAKII